MTLRIIDIETTGTDPATDDIIEIASVDLRELDDLAVPIDYQESTIRDFASPIISGHMRFPCSQTGVELHVLRTGAHGRNDRIMLCRHFPSLAGHAAACACVG